MKIFKKIILFIGLCILLSLLAFGLLFLQGEQLPNIFTGLCVLVTGFMISDAIKNKDNKD
jgi:uncharacterized membrane protein YccC